MHVITARNVNDALYQGINYLSRVGISRDSRNGPVKVSPIPVTTVYMQPLERVLFWKDRDANPFFHLYESLWMLAGRNDVTPLVKYAKQMHQYSDDGKTLHGAYGYRWRHAFGRDQLALITDALKKNRDDRRQVLQMWDARQDLGRVGKDLPCNTIATFQINTDGELDLTVFCRSNDIIWGCLAADTPVLSPEGEISIKNLAEKFQEGLQRYPVFSVDTITGSTSLQWCTKAWQSGIKPVIELKFDDGSTLKLTSDHRLYKRKWKSDSNQEITEVAAGDLKVGDRVWAPRPYLKGDGRWYIKSNIFNRNRKAVKVAVEYAKLLYGLIPDGHVVHHKNDQQWDDRAENIEVKPKSQHQIDHVLKYNPGFDKVNAEMSYEERMRRAALGRQSRWSDSSQHEKQRKLMNLLRRDGRINHQIVSISYCDPEPVYDLSVENTHTALVGTGVLAHNCYGANAVHFSFLLEYMALWIGVPVGKLYQVSVNWHAYLDVFGPLETGFRDPVGLAHDYQYNIKPLCLSGSISEIDSAIEKILVASDVGASYDFKPKWVWTMNQILYAHQLWSVRAAPERYESALEVLNKLDPEIDFVVAAKDWVARRAAKWMQKMVAK